MRQKKEAKGGKIEAVNEEEIRTADNTQYTVVQIPHHQERHTDRKDTHCWQNTASTAAAVEAVSAQEIAEELEKEQRLLLLQATAEEAQFLGLSVSVCLVVGVRHTTVKGQRSKDEVGSSMVGLLLLLLLLRRCSEND